MEKSFTLRRQYRQMQQQFIRMDSSIARSESGLQIQAKTKVQIQTLSDLINAIGGQQKARNIFEIGDKQIIINEETFFNRPNLGLTNISLSNKPLMKKQQCRLHQSGHYDEIIQSPYQPPIHLAYLFASPLVIHTSGENYWEGLPAISFRQEFEGIIEKIEESKTQFRCCYQMATEENLNYCLGLKPVGIHFSGHGFENNQLAFVKDRGAWERDKHRGDFLMFEQENGASKNMYTSQLKEILEKYDCKKLSFVVVASCFSLCCGKIFEAAGVDHVICIDKGKEIDDKAAVTFSRAFYKAIFTSGRTICSAFEIAREAVKHDNPTAFKKFKKIPEEDCTKCNQQSSKLIFQRHEGSIEILGELPLIYKVPSRVEPFLFRNRDMFEILNMIQQPNIQVVQVYAMIPGTGKSSLLRNLTNHVFERNLYKSGVIYFNLHKVNNAADAFEQIIQYFNQKIKAVKRRARKFIGLEQQRDVGSRIISILNTFNEKHKALIVLDNLNFLKPNNQDMSQSQQFSVILNSVLHEIKNVHVIFSTNFYVKDIDNMRVKRLFLLNKDQPFELFIKKIPCDDARSKLEDMSAIKELHEYTLTLKLPNVNLPKPCQVQHTHNQQCMRLYLSKHPIIERLGGHPLAISIIASMLVNMSLKEIFQKLHECDQQNQGAMQFSTNSDVYEETLLQSLEMSFMQLKERDPKCVDIFLLIGLTHDGLNKQNLIEIFENVQEAADNTEERLKILTDSSFIQAGKILGQEVYRVPYLVDFFIDHKLEQTAKFELFNILGDYFNKKIKSLLESSQGNSKFETEVKQFIERHAPDIQVALDCLLQTIDVSNNLHLSPNSNSTKQLASNKQLASFKFSVEPLVNNQAGAPITPNKVVENPNNKYFEDSWISRSYDISQGRFKDEEDNQEGDFDNIAVEAVDDDNAFNGEYLKAPPDPKQNKVVKRKGTKLSSTGGISSLPKNSKTPEKYREKGHSSITDESFSSRFESMVDNDSQAEEQKSLFARRRPLMKMHNARRAENSLISNDDLQAFIIHAQITQAFGKSEEEQEEERKSERRALPKFEAQDLSSPRNREMESVSSGFFSNKSKVFSDIMEAYHIKKEHRKYLERLQTRISEFKIDMNQNKQNQDSDDVRNQEEIARTNSMLIRFQTIRKDHTVTSYNQQSRSNTVNILARNFKMKTRGAANIKDLRSPVLSQITQSEISSVRTVKVKQKSISEQISEVASIKNPLSTGELLLVSYLKLLRFRNQLLSLQESNPTQSEDYDSQYDDESEENEIETSSAPQPPSLNPDQEILQLIDRYQAQITQNLILSSQIEDIKIKSKESQVQKIEKWNTFVQQKTINKQNSIAKKNRIISIDEVEQPTNIILKKKKSQISQSSARRAADNTNIQQVRQPTQVSIQEEQKKISPPVVVNRQPTIKLDHDVDLNFKIEPIRSQGSTTKGSSFGYHHSFTQTARFNQTTYFQPPNYNEEKDSLEECKEGSNNQEQLTSEHNLMPVKIKKSRGSGATQALTTTFALQINTHHQNHLPEINEQAHLISQSSKSSLRRTSYTSSERPCTLRRFLCGLLTPTKKYQDSHEQ